MRYRPHKAHKVKCPCGEVFMGKDSQRFCPTCASKRRSIYSSWHYHHSRGHEVPATPVKFVEKKYAAFLAERRAMKAKAKERRCPYCGRIHYSYTSAYCAACRSQGLHWVHSLTGRSLADKLRERSA